MPTEHTVKSFDEEIDYLNRRIAEMGGLAETQMAAAVRALAGRDSRLAAQVIDDDRRIDAMESDVEATAVRMLALRQPVASDLRNIVVSVKVASDLERIGDYAKNIAKRSIALEQLAPLPASHQVPRLSRMVEAMIRDVLDAYAACDPEKALAVWRRDGEVDDACTGMLRELLTYMMEDPRSITASTHLLFVSRNIERVGDHTTNIAENVYYLATGERLDEDRPRGGDPALDIE
ncbi:MAG: phosphate signaling complex protein PhoU [Rhodospirillaceae bacterium]